MLFKIGNFSLIPVFFGGIMAILDLVMMACVKMVSTGSLSAGVGMPIAIFTYALEPIVFSKALKYENMVVTNLVWNLVSDVLVTLQGIFIFGESIRGIRWVAICMALVSLAIFSYTDNN